MKYDHMRIKENARKFYKLNIGTSIVVPLLCGICTTAITYLISLPFSAIFGTSFYNAEDLKNASPFGTMIYYIVSYAMYFFVTGIIQMGSTDWFRRSIFNNTDIGEAFSFFKQPNYLRNVGTIALRTLYIALWSLLLFIPGIIAYYRYSMVEFIRGEYPELSVSETMNLCKKLTDGHKGKLFYLDLSFIGWFLLSLLTFGILAIVYVTPYYQAAKAFAYLELKADAEPGVLPDMPVMEMQG